MENSLYYGGHTQDEELTVLRRPHTRWRTHCIKKATHKMTKYNIPLTFITSTGVMPSWQLDCFPANLDQWEQFSWFNKELGVYEQNHSKHTKQPSTVNFVTDNDWMQIGDLLQRFSPWFWMVFHHLVALIVLIFRLGTVQLSLPAINTVVTCIVQWSHI